MRRALLTFLLLAPAWVPAAALAQGGGQGGDPSFNLVNRSGQPIREIYVSPARESHWGPDRLGANVLPDGRAFPVRLPPEAGCQQDVRVVYADGRPEERRGQDTCRITEMVFGTAAAAPPRAAEGQGANPSFNLVNHGRAAIREIYVSPARDNHWGPDRLGQEVLPPGRHLAIRLPLNDCVNDIRVVWQDGRAEDRRQVDTCRLTNLVLQ
jgi:hypothetical protein